MGEFTFMIVITIISLIITLFICINRKVNRIYKFLPSIIIAVGSISYCIIATIVNYNRYILILYVIMFLYTFPSFIICLIIAITFDLVRVFSQKRKNTNQVP